MSREKIERVHRRLGVTERYVICILDVVVVFDSAKGIHFSREKSEPVCNLHDWKKRMSNRFSNL